MTRINIAEQEFRISEFKKNNPVDTYICNKCNFHFQSNHCNSYPVGLFSTLVAKDWFDRTFKNFRLPARVLVLISSASSKQL